MLEVRGNIDLTYLDEVFQPDRLDAVSTRLLEVLKNAGLAPDVDVPGGRRSQEEVDDACSDLLEPIGLELRELEPRRYGLVCSDILADHFLKVIFSPDSDAVLDAVLLASWLLRSGRVYALGLGPTQMVTQPLSAVIKATLPFCAGTLQLLHLHSYRMPLFGVEHVLSGAASLEGLESLHLMYLFLTASATLSIGRLLLANAKSLKALVIGADKIEGGREIVGCVCQCLNLTSLRLRCLPIDDGELKRFQDFLEATDTLQTLTVEHCDQRECRSILLALRGNHSLKNVILSVKHEEAGSLGEEVAKVLQDNKSLESLTLQNLSLTSPESIACVFAALKDNRTLKHFSVGLVDLIKGGRDERETGSAVVAVVQENRTLKRLCIERCEMTSKTMKTLARALVTNPVLSILRIGTNKLQDDSSNSFREAVRACCDRIETRWNRAGLEELALTLPQSHVEQLYLEWPEGIENPPIVQLLKGLSANQTITRLHIDDIGYFGNVEIATLADYLRNTVVLKWISMTYEVIFPSYGFQLYDALAENSSVYRADFGHFIMELQTCEHFGSMLAKNRTLECVSQGYEFSESRELEPIARGMESNHTLVSLTIGSSHPCRALSRIRRALAANNRRLNRAVDFVLETVSEGQNSQCEEAFRLLFRLESLRKQLAKVTSSSDARVEELIAAALKRLPEAMSV